jgi:hypothetical protein
VFITADSGDNILRINNDHQVVSKRDASLRIQHINGQIPINISWCIYPQTSNAMFTHVDNRPLFIAPAAS